MKKTLNISLIFGFLLVFSACEKEEFLPVDSVDYFSTETEDNQRNPGETTDGGNVNNGGIVDPDEEDEDLNNDSLDNGNIVDPDEDDEDLQEPGNEN